MYWHFYPECLEFWVFFSLIWNILLIIYQYKFKGCHENKGIWG
jgi:hypothetical protein